MVYQFIVLKNGDLIVLKNGGSFHGYVSHNQMVKKSSWAWQGLWKPLVIPHLQFEASRVLKREKKAMGERW